MGEILLRVASLFGPLTVVSLGVSAVLVLLTFRSARRTGDSGRLLLMWIGFSAITFFAAIILLVPFLHCLLSVALIVVACILRLRPTWVAATTAAAGLFCYGMFAAEAYSRAARHDRWAAENPLVSLASRLEYETQRRPDGPPDGDWRLSPAVEKRLLENESYGGGSIRRHDLKKLHSASRRHFIEAVGFGLMRMQIIYDPGRQLPELKPIPLHSSPEIYLPETESSQQSPLLAHHPGPIRLGDGSLDIVHEQSHRDFLDPERIGYVQDREHVAGFVPHQLTVDSVDRWKETMHAAWQITNLELVSLLKHDEALAYVSDELPKMDELDDAPTRPLDAFETQALARLQHDEDLVIDEGVNRIRMFGSLRASQHCLQCHTAQRGELLGAFTYELRRIRPVPAPKPAEDESPRAERVRELKRRVSQR